MKSKYELNYEKMITAMILSDDHSQHNRLELFMEFHRNSNYYYELLCDCLFAMASGKTKSILYLTPSGKPYLSERPHCEADRQLLTWDQVPEFEDDLKEQLEFSLIALQELSMPSTKFRV